MIYNPDKNIVRKILTFLKPYINTCIGGYYALLHTAIMGLTSLVILFDNNIIHLIILFIIIMFDCLTCVIIHDCPLTILERKYLKKISCYDTRKQVLNKMGIVHKCNHRYEITLEFLINISSLLYFKILILIAYKYIYGYRIY